MAITATLTIAMTTVAAAQDRCEGTLCDLYYDHMAKPSSPQAPPPARTATQASQGRTSQGQASQPAQGNDGVLSRLFGGAPAPQPAEGVAPAKRPMVAVQGDGVVGLLQGRAPGRCTGTLCDLYYGGPPPEEPAAKEPATGPAAPARPAQAADTGIDEPVATSRGIEPRESVSRCASKAHDPWACYR